MQVKEFIDKCVDSGYEWAEGEHDGNSGYFIRSERFETKAHFTNEAIEKNDWPRLNRSIVQGKDIYHVTRVVGYYSRIQNWNKSKIGELKDRHAGEYLVK
ncbi:MAG: hypothetical protein ABH843_08350 [Candidatus Omnitrophota bacterium]